MTAEIAMTGIRLFLHIGTAALLAGYWNPSARFRLGPSVLAGFLLCSSAGMAVHILANWHRLQANGVPSDHQPVLLALGLAVFLPVAWVRGDMAKLCDRISGRIEG